MPTCLGQADKHADKATIITLTVLTIHTSYFGSLLPAAATCLLFLALQAVDASCRSLIALQAGCASLLFELLLRSTFVDCVQSPAMFECIAQDDRLISMGKVLEL